MTAAFNVYKDTGGSDGSPGAQTNVDGLGPPMVRFKTNDDTTIDTVDPIPVISGQTKRSYVNSLYIKCSTAPTTKVDNLKFYTDGSGFGTGISVYVKSDGTFPTKNSGSSAGYKKATGTPGDTGTELVTLYGGSKSSAFGYTSGSPLTGPTISEGSSLIDAVNETCNYLVLQMDVDGSLASPGDLANETFTIQYDEI